MSNTSLQNKMWDHMDDSSNASSPASSPFSPISSTDTCITDDNEKVAHSSDDTSHTSRSGSPSNTEAYSPEEAPIHPDVIKANLAVLFAYERSHTQNTKQLAELVQMALSPSPDLSDQTQRELNSLIRYEMRQANRWNAQRRESQVPQ